MSNINLFSCFPPWKFGLILTLYENTCLGRYEWQRQRQILYRVFHRGYVFFACRWKPQCVLLCWNHTHSNQVRHWSPPLFKVWGWNYPHLIDNWLCNLTHRMEGKSPITGDLAAIFGPLFNLMSLQSVCPSKYLSVDREALFPMAPPCVPSWWLSAGQASYELHLFAVRWGLKYLAEPDRAVEPHYCFAYCAGFGQAVTMWVYDLILKEKFHKCAGEDIGAGNPCLHRAR